MAVGLILRFLELELVDAVVAVDVVIRLLGELIMWLEFLDIEKDDNEVENGDSDVVDDEQGDNDEDGNGWAGWAPTRWWPVTDDPLAASAPEPVGALGPGGWGPCLTMDDGPGLPDNLSPPVSPVHSGSR